MTHLALDRVAVAHSVTQLVITESRLSLDPADIAESEPLNGELLRVNSLGFVGMLVRLEDEIGVELPDDLFVGRRFHTVGDLVDVVMAAAGGTA